MHREYLVDKKLKNIMLYKEKNDIIAWLDKYDVKNYTLRPDETYGYVVDVAGNVDLSNKMLENLRVKFGNVKGSFYCSDNKLTSLNSVPESVGKDFYCNDNQLTSLEGSPHTIGRHFICISNKLTSLNGVPESIRGYFYCRGNPGLGELQNMVSFKEIKAYLLGNQLANDLNIKDNKKKVKL